MTHSHSTVSIVEGRVQSDLKLLGQNAWSTDTASISVFHQIAYWSVAHEMEILIQPNKSIAK